MRELIYKDEAYKAIDNCTRDSWDRISPADAKMNIHHLVSDANEADRPQMEWIHLKGDEWLCPNCGHVVWTEGSWEHPLERGKIYCENCGTRLKGADDENV